MSDCTKSYADFTPCTKKRILIVDDEKDIRKVFKQILSFGMPDCRIDLAINGLEAVESFRDIHQQVILMDLFMPEMNGETAISEIEKICKENDWVPPKIIVCTGYKPSESLEKRITNNPNNCLICKPIVAENLLSEIECRLQD